MAAEWTPVSQPVGAQTWARWSSSYPLTLSLLTAFERLPLNNQTSQSLFQGSTVPLKDRLSQSLLHDSVLRLKDQISWSLLHDGIMPATSCRCLSNNCTMWSSCSGVGRERVKTDGHKNSTGWFDTTLTTLFSSNENKASPPTQPITSPRSGPWPTQ